MFAGRRARDANLAHQRYRDQWTVLRYLFTSRKSDMRRRDFLKSSASFSGAMLLGAGGRTFGQTPRTTRIGLQLYSVRNSLAKDHWGTLKEVARAGYHYVEAANHQARTDPGVGFGVK